MPATVIDSGTYTFEVDSGFDYGSFRLGDSAKGVLGNTTYKLGPTTSYVDVSQYVKRISYKRGRRRTVDQFGAGTMTVVVDDQLAGGILNPLDDGSPYYNTTDDYFGLEPGRRIRLSRDVSGTPQYLFIGTIVTYDYKYQLAGNDEVSIQCADDFYLLSQAVLDAWNVSSETSGQRLTSLLDLPEVDLFDPIERSIATGTVNLGHDNSYNVPSGTNALAYANQINQTAEGGRLFMSRSGVFTFTNRIYGPLSNPSAEFNNSGTQIPYNDLSIDFDGSDVINRAVVVGLNGTTDTETNTDSINTYGYRTYRIDNSLLHQASEIATYAFYLLYPYPSAVFTSLQTAFAQCSTTQRNTLTNLDIGNVIQITAAIPGTGGNTTQQAEIEGIECTIDFRRGHVVRYYISETVDVYYLLLGNSTYGTLNGSNVLG